MTRRRIARWGVVLIGVSALGCHDMRTIPAEQIGGAHVWPKIWVTLTDHSTVVLDAPGMRGDTLFGFVGERVYREMPLSEVESIHAREGARTRTAMVVGTSVAAMTGLLVYFGNRSYVGGNAQTCSSGSTTGDVADNLPVACCRVNPSIPC